MLDLRRVVQRLVRRRTSADRGRASAPPGFVEAVGRLPATHQAAALKLRDPALVQSLKWRRRSVEVDVSLLHPKMREYALALTRELERRSLPFFIHCGYRGEAEQNAAFANGVSRARYGSSPHNYGLAIDVIHLTRGWDLTRLEWSIMAAVFGEVARKRHIKIEWGGDWSFYDPAHIQIANWRALSHG